MSTINPDKDLTTWFDETRWFPFVEDENGNITGPGHQDKEAFVKAVDAYDSLCTGNTWVDVADAVAVAHEYVRQSDKNSDYIRICRPSDEGAVPVTTYWGQR